MAEMRSGYVDYRGFKTYYEIYGECRPGKKPLLILHGGPGDTHLYLLNYRDMADLYGRQIIFYDQIGCGKSNIPHQDDDFYGYDLWIDEFYTMRDALGLDDFHLFGNSWGGMLAMMCACKDDAGIRSMVINGSPVNIATWLSEANRLIEYMPKDMQEAIAEAERTGDYDTPAAKAAYMEYYRRHVVGVEPWPDYVQEAFSEENVGECYMVSLVQSGIGLPDEAYYRQEDYAPIREAYVAHTARLLAWLSRLRRSVSMPTTSKAAPSSRRKTSDLPLLT